MDAIWGIFINTLFWGTIVWLIWRRRKKKKALLQQIFSNSEPKATPRTKFAEHVHAKEWMEVKDLYWQESFEAYRIPSQDQVIMAKAYYELGDKRMMQQMLDEAESLIDGVKDRFNVFYNGAIMLRDSDEYEKALGMVMRADLVEFRELKFWEEYYPLLRVGADCFRRMGKYNELIQFLKQAPITSRQLTKELAQVHEYMAEAYEEIGEYDKAAKSLEKVQAYRYDMEVSKRIEQLLELHEEQKEAKKRKRKGLDY